MINDWTDWLENIAIPVFLFYIVRKLLEIFLRIIYGLIVYLIILLSLTLIKILFPLRISPYYAILTEYIENKFITTFFFGNKGWDTIKRDDIEEADPITVYVEDGVIIGIPKIEFAKPVNQFNIKLSPDKKSFKINFDYIAKNEGAIIKFYHTRNSNKKTNVKLRGIIKAYGTPKEYWFPPTIYTIFYAIMLYICIFLVIHGTKSLIMYKDPSDYIFGLPFLILFIVASINFYRYCYYGIMKPKGFKGTPPGPLRAP